MKLPPLALAALALAGCVAPPVDAPTPEDSRMEPLALSGCRMVIAFVPLDMGDASARLPEGFAPLPHPQVPTAARGAAWVWTCDAIENRTGAWADAWSAILVHAPEAWRSDDVAWHAVLLEGANDRAVMVAHYATWNVTIAEGDVRLESSVGAPHTQISAQAALAGGPLAVELRSVEPTTQGPEGVVRVFATRDGAATGAFEYAWTPYERTNGAVTITAHAQLYGRSGPLVGTGAWEAGSGYSFVRRPVALN